MAVVTTGMTVTYQTGFFAEILNFDWSGMTREAIETTNMSSTTAKTYTPSTLYDPGTIDVELIFDPETDPTGPLAAAAETVTITYADPAPASTMAASGFMSEFAIAGPLEDRMTATAKLQLSGAITHG